MVVRTQSATHFGPEGVVVEIEASLQKSLPAVVITGLPGDVVKESRERIRACLAGMGFDVPSSRLVVHLSPATAKKQGSQLDLGIAVAWLAAEGVLKPKSEVRRLAFLGELSLDGRVRGVHGALALAESLLKIPGLETLYLPKENAAETALLRSARLAPVESLAQLIAVLEGKSAQPSVEISPEVPAPALLDDALDRVRGQRLAKRALQVALAGRHHLLLVGPPGVGKSLLARAACSLLPPLDENEVVEVLKNHGLGETRSGRAERPFRSPHHTISAAGLLGGGSGGVVVGEVTLAHAGILFLDELPEFRKDALEGLREPLQSGEIHMNRVGSRFTLPARFQLLAAMNPCPCGYDGDSRRKCSCPPGKAVAYRRKVSGPLYDRLDLSVFLHPPSGTRDETEPETESFRTTIARVRALQKARESSSGGEGEGQVDLEDGPFAVCGQARAWLDALCGREYFSFRSLHKLVRVSRTIADLESSEAIGPDHLREAWELRCRDLANWR